MGHVTWQRPFQGHFVIRRLGLAVFNPHKCEMSTITGLRGNVHGSSMARWKARGRLPIGANWIFLASSHGCGTIKRKLSKSAFSDGGGSP